MVAASRWSTAAPMGSLLFWPSPRTLIRLHFRGDQRERGFRRPSPFRPSFKIEFVGDFTWVIRSLRQEASERLGGDPEKAAVVWGSSPEDLIAHLNNFLVASAGSLKEKALAHLPQALERIKREGWRVLFFAQKGENFSFSGAKIEGIEPPAPEATLPLVDLLEEWSGFGVLLAREGRTVYIRHPPVERLPPGSFQNLLAYRAILTPFLSEGEVVEAKEVLRRFRKGF